MCFCPYFYQYYFQSPNSTHSIAINTAANTIILYKDDQLYKTYPVAAGKPPLIPTRKKIKLS